MSALIRALVIIPRSPTMTASVMPNLSRTTVLAERHLRTGPGGFGLLLGVIGAGAALGPLALARLTTHPRRPALVFGPYLLRGLAAWPSPPPAACRSP